MYVIRDRNNVPIDLYFLCFTSPTLSLFLSDEGGKKGKLVYFSEQRWMDRGEKFWSVGRWHGSKTDQNIILRWFTISMYFSWCMGVRINYGVVHKLEKQMYWQDSQRKKNSFCRGKRRKRLMKKCRSAYISKKLHFRNHGLVFLEAYRKCRQWSRR